MMRQEQMEREGEGTVAQTELLKVSHLRTQFTTKDGIVPAVNDVSFCVDPGQVLGIVGESGCGKSVTSLSILKLIEKYNGQVLEGSSVKLEGRELLQLPEQEMCNVRGREIAMIFQDPMTSLNPVFTIERQMVETIMRHRHEKRGQARAHAIEWLQKVGIPEPEKRIKEYPHQLSGGMRQRVIIAIALSCDPKILIADEPTTALDVTIQAQILDLLRKLKEQVNAAIILITHDMGVVADMADHIMVMYAGCSVEYGTKQQIFKEPRHPYTRGLLKSIPRMEKESERLFSIEGSVPNLTKPIEGCVFRERCSCALEKCAHCRPPEFRLAGGNMVSCWLYEKDAKENSDA